MSFATLIRHAPREVAFGFLHKIAATIGQTFVISLFLPGIKESFALGDAEVSLLFTGTTLASAAALWKIGAWIDRADLLRYSLACGVFLALSCAMVAAAPVLSALIVGMFGLRLAGNGLLAHVALTATARYFANDRGRALSLVLLGSSAGEGVFPAILVALVAAWGWRPTLIATGCVGLLLVLAAAAAVRGNAAFRRPHAPTPAATAAPSGHRATAKHGDHRRYFAGAALLFVAMPMIITATIFHQALIAQDKGLSLQWFAVSFIAFAIVRVPISILTGRIVDRAGSAWLFSVHLLPLAGGAAALIVIGASWIAPLYWLSAGVTAGMGSVLQTTVVAERVSPARLGAARSVLAAVAIVASAVGPSLYGLALAAGATIAAILWGSVVLLVVATGLGVLAARAEDQRRR